MTSEALAEGDGAAITAGEVEQTLGAPLRNLEEQISTLKCLKLDARIANRLLACEAAQRGITVQALLEAAIAKVERRANRQAKHDGHER